MNLELTNKIGFVTGASSGIGAMTARIIAEEGADVVVSFAHDEAGASAAARNVESTGRRAWLSQMDVSDPGSVDGAVELLKTAVGQLDVLILCAGQNIVTPWNEITPEEWDQVMGVNLTGALHVLRACSCMQAARS